MEADIYDNSKTPCKRGHTDGRYFSNDMCVECTRLNNRMRRDPQFGQELRDARQALKDFNHHALACLEATQAYIGAQGLHDELVDGLTLKLKADWEALQEAVAYLERYA